MGQVINFPSNPEREARVAIRRRLRAIQDISEIPANPVDGFKFRGVGSVAWYRRHRASIGWAAWAAMTKYDHNTGMPIEGTTYHAARPNYRRRHCIYYGCLARRLDNHAFCARHELVYMAAHERQSKLSSLTPLNKCDWSERRRPYFDWSWPQHSTSSSVGPCPTKKSE